MQDHCAPHAPVHFPLPSPPPPPPSPRVRRLSPASAESDNLRGNIPKERIMGARPYSDNVCVLRDPQVHRRPGSESGPSNGPLGLIRVRGSPQTCPGMGGLGSETIDPCVPTGVVEVTTSCRSHNSKVERRGFDPPCWPQGFFRSASPFLFWVGPFCRAI